MESARKQTRVVGYAYQEGLYMQEEPSGHKFCVHRKDGGSKLDQRWK